MVVTYGLPINKKDPQMQGSKDIMYFWQSCLKVLGFAQSRMG